MKNYLVIGGGPAGVAAVEAILARDADARIRLFTKEQTLPYTRPMLTKTPFCFFDPARYVIHDGAWYASRGVEVITGEQIVALDAGAHVARTAAQDYPYDKCIYAAGGYNFLPPFRGVEKTGVCSVRGVCDIERLKQAAHGKRNAVVIGGGAIGLETAFELMRYGLQATVLEAQPYLMPRQLDADTAEALCERLAPYFGIHANIEIEEIEGGDAVGGVRLKDGRRFPADLVVVSCGVRPETALAQAAGIRCGRAVLVNERMETSAPDVYACGDCAEYAGLNYMLYAEAWSQGTVAGANAAGGAETYAGADTSLIVNTPYVSLFAFGDTAKGPGPYVTEVQKRRITCSYAVNPAFAEAEERLFYLDGKLVGATILGNLSHMQDIKEAILEEQHHA